ncbi:hypothetical protein ACH5RR_041371 [Cinchona calisaya]|uniref:C2H2-type domain-containing protein n=1 Tax=Cinchona calisaya TaxID=153742 RepID=A0ABD2XWP0_9GENT
MIKGGMVVNDSMSNLTSASNDASISSSNNRIEVGGAVYPQQPLASQPSNLNQPPTKKKRNLPGNPDPEAEVIALSPRTLMATNRFVCEICNKGFQREQNLQLHRRGHNLPWKLKQRTNKEVIRKKVYLCPETTCVHHDPSRALGDLTGIKKHFSRKHGEKKWKCEKCSKRYAVQSDWKAHSKICGTREYRCDCGTLFSRRDSFITHRAFCDALAEESARAMTPNPLLLASQSAGGGGSTSATIQLHLQNPHLHGGAGSGLPIFPLKREQDHHHHHHLQQSFNTEILPPWLATGPTSNHHDLFTTTTNNNNNPPITMSLHQENLNLNPNQQLSSFQEAAAVAAAMAAAVSPHMSATALLQKAAQMGVTMSKPCPLTETTTTTTTTAFMRPHQGAHMTSSSTNEIGIMMNSTTAGSSLGLSSREEMGFMHPGLASFGNKTLITTSSGCMEQVGPNISDHHHHHHGAFMMSSFATSSSSQNHHGFDQESTTLGSDNFPGNIFLNAKRDNEEIINFQEKTSSREGGVGVGGGGGGNDGLTRDFLGLKAFPHREFLNLDDLHHMGSSYEQQQQDQNPAPWQS